MLLKVQRHVTPALACSDGLAGAPAAAHCMLTYSSGGPRQLSVKCGSSMLTKHSGQSARQGQERPGGEKPDGDSYQPRGACRHPIRLRGRTVQPEHAGWRHLNPNKPGRVPASAARGCAVPDAAGPAANKS